MDQDTRERESDVLSRRIAAFGLDYATVRRRLRAFSVGAGDWCFVSPVSRFRSSPMGCGAENTWEKLQDMQEVKNVAGCFNGMTLNTFGLKKDAAMLELSEVVDYCGQNGLEIYSVQPNSVKDPAFTSGSMTHPDPEIRARFRRNALEAIEFAETLHARTVSIWLGDGTNYPGQGDFVHRKQKIQIELKEIYSALPSKMELHIEYKFFEPASYHTDIADWGMAFVFAKKCGERAKVLMDVGHHPLGANLEHTAAFLLDENMLGSIHLNSKKYADDDLTAGSINPYEIFLIFKEVAEFRSSVSSPNDDACLHFTLDQFHYVKPPILGVLQAVLVSQELYAKALLVNVERLKETAEDGDYVGAERILQDAFYTDVKALLQDIRLEDGRDPDPYGAMISGEYYKKILDRRE
jgi:L-rhamnose isomerase/sugar isomerase